MTPTRPSIKNTSTLDRVRGLYERRPYPHYPLLAKPRWQDGYLGTSFFARLLLTKDLRAKILPAQKVLCVGSGEILPYILRRWEPAKTQVTCVDLSQRSLRRAKFRCLFHHRNMKFVCDDISKYLMENPNEKFDHIEAFGVLHHITNFKTAVARMAESLNTSGTMRVMVYNAYSRQWIWTINRALRTLGLRYDRDTDVTLARDFLFKLASRIPLLDQHLQSMGRSSLNNNTRFADTFLHPWESRASISEWLQTFRDNKLRPYALFDRYEELEDLANTLWSMPSDQDLEVRTKDYRFEGNLEVWLTNAESYSHSQLGEIPPRDHALNSTSVRRTRPPTQWLKNASLKKLGLLESQRLWKSWLECLESGSNLKVLETTVAKLKFSTEEKGRLARLGIIPPLLAQEDPQELQSLNSPLSQKISAPDLTRLRSKLERSEITSMIEQFFPNTLPKKLDIAAKRLQKLTSI